MPDSQAALVASTGRKERYQRRNDRRDTEPAPDERVLERPPTSEYVRTPLKGHVPYLETAGSAWHCQGSTHHHTD